MKFIDEATITVQSGNGGAGCVSFRREKYVPRGGPDGGDGGRGGDVILQSSSRRRTLLPFRYKRQFKAQNGASGQGSQKTGRSGQDLVIEVPPGTLVRDAETLQILKDFLKTGENHTVAKGGRGGLGNYRFKRSTRQTPRFAQPGEQGQTLKLHLELKLIADVGIIGLPNAGKSTLIGSISSAKPKIADYAFTTLTPNLGVVQGAGGEPFVVADIPGLIDGAHRGAGMGTRFLKHIERTRILLHLIDVSAIEEQHPLRVYETILQELSHYNRKLAQKPQMLVLNKMDLPGSLQKASVFEAALAGGEVYKVSALTRQGLKELISALSGMLAHLDGLGDTSPG